MRILLTTGYNGAIKSYVILKGEKHILENETLEEIIKEALEKKPYTIEKTPRQKYPRIIIKKTERQEITVPLSENDLQELQSGEEFNWTFPTQYGEPIDVVLRQETEEDIID